MPYDNEYNRQIARDLGAINERFAKLHAYSPVDGRGGGYSEGGSNAGVLFQIGNASKRDGEDNVYNNDLALPPVYYYGQDAEALEGGSGFGASTFRDTGFDRVIGAGAASGQFTAGAHDLMNGGNLWTDIGDGFSDLAGDAGKLGKYVFGGKKGDARMLGRQLAEAAKLHGGSWWDSIKEGVNDVVGLVPELLAAAKPKRVRKAKLAGGDAAAAEVAAPASAAAAALAGGASDRIVGGAILGNPDPYPRKGNSARIAGRGRSKKAAPVLQGPNGDLLAACPVVLPNGVPPTAQLRGSYGGKKPAAPSKAAVIAAVKAKLAGGAACVDSPAIVHVDVEAAPKKPKKGGKNLAGATAPAAPAAPAAALAGAGAGAKRAARVAIVKRVMAERGCGMIEASKYVKANGLYKP
jgi:hypothetical protein